MKVFRMRGRGLWLISLILALGGPSLAFSQAFVEQLSPPVLKRGATTRIEIHGSDTAGAVGLWSSLPAEVFRARPVSLTENSSGGAAFDVELTSEAPLGLYGLRLATRSGLSNVHLFVVDELPVTCRMGTPARPAVATAEDGTGKSAHPPDVMPLSLPTCVTSTCRAADIDRYAITVEKGQRVAFEVIGNRFGKDYDPLVCVRNAAGKRVAECDNSVGLFFDCRFAHTFADAGTHTVEVRDARYEGHPTWHYVLRMGDFPEARVAVPSAARAGELAMLTFPQTVGLQMPVEFPAARSLGGLFHEVRRAPGGVATWVPLTVSDLAPQLEVEPNDTLETASPVSVPATLNGVLEKPGDRDWFAFELTQGQKLTIQGVARAIGSAADLELFLFDADGREVRRVDDTELDEGSFTFNAGKAGKYRLQVRDLTRDGGPEFAYRIDVRAGGPLIQLLAEVAELTVPRGTFQPLPLKITRTEFNGEIRLELRGAPPGITLEPNVIPAGATEFVGQVIAAESVSEGLSTLQVVGTAAFEAGGVLQAVATTKPLVDRQLKNVDLQIYALREDQRHLPPSLTNQIALMVTPPSPFQVELPEAVVRLTRYQSAEFPIVSTRARGYGPPITFAVQGGQIGEERQERNQVYVRFNPATADRLSTSGTFFNRILTNLNKHRVDLTATSEVDGRRINLIRTFTLEIQSAFQPTFEPSQPTAEPGGSIRMKILANRVATFDGPVTFNLTPQSGFQFPATVEIARGEPAAEFEVVVDSKQNPGRYTLRVEAAGFVGKYEESFNVQNVSIEVKKPMQ
jgi:pre-peptidase